MRQPIIFTCNHLTQGRGANPLSAVRLHAQQSCYSRNDDVPGRLYRLALSSGAQGGLVIRHFVSPRCSGELRQQNLRAMTRRLKEERRWRVSFSDSSASAAWAGR